MKNQNVIGKIVSITPGNNSTEVTGIVRDETKQTITLKTKRKTIVIQKQNAILSHEGKTFRLANKTLSERIKGNNR